jgi:enoyl-CoA hydratase
MIERKDAGSVVVLSMAHGPVNVLDTAMLRTVSETFAVLSEEQPAAVVITGAGRAFSAGVDLRSFLVGGPDYTTEFLPALSDALLAVFSFDRPVVAAVNGHAIAGGAVLACAADARVMAEGKARIGTPELLVGVPFPRVPLEILSFAVGPKLAGRLVFGGDTVSPELALALGLVDEVVPPDELLDRALAVANRLATAIPADSFAMSKTQLRRESLERIARYRVDEDPKAEELWNRRRDDGWTERYLGSVTGKG